MDNKNEILIYEDKDGITKINVTFTNEDIWLTQNQLGEIYKTSRENITMHISNIYKDKELPKDSTCKKFLQVQNKLYYAVHEHTAAELIYDMKSLMLV